MPIRFRCGYCSSLLEIARRKAGTDATCPHCGYTLTVPQDPVNAKEMVDLDEFLRTDEGVDGPRSKAASGRQSAATSSLHAESRQPAPSGILEDVAAISRAQDGRESQDGEILSLSDSATTSKSQSSDGLVFGNASVAAGPHARIEQSGILLSPQMAAGMAIFAAILLAFSFAAGYLLGAMSR